MFPIPVHISVYKWIASGGKYDYSNCDDDDDDDEEDDASQLRGSILSFGYCLCCTSHVFYVFTWVSAEFCSFL